LRSTLRRALHSYVIDVTASILIKPYSFVHVVMLRTGKRPRKAPAVLALTWRILHIQPETAAEVRS